MSRRALFPVAAALLAPALAACPEVTPPAGPPDLRRADLPASDGDSLPEGAVAFFRTIACPAGWVAYEAAAGRVLVPTVGNAVAGAKQGQPLASGEEAKHGHDVAATVALDGVSYAGIAGEANHGVAAAAMTKVMAPTSTVSPSLPYVQLLACRKFSAARPAARPLPPGMLSFFATTTCPDGWQQAAATQGRVIVGAPLGAASGLAFGGAPLTGEDRTHTHSVTAAMTTMPHGIALASGCCAGGYAANKSYPFNTTTSPSSVGLPYLTLLQCQKL